MAKAKWPSIWAMTDERMGEELWPALERLPAGAGVVLRHQAAADRIALAKDMAAFTRRRELVLAVAGDAGLAKAVGADLVHNPDADTSVLPFSLAVHSRTEAMEANRRGAALAFVSPVFATRSHPGASSLSKDDARCIVQMLDCPAIALGGVDARNFVALEGLGFRGWAGIDAWLRT